MEKTISKGIQVKRRIRQVYKKGTINMSVVKVINVLSVDKYINLSALRLVSNAITVKIISILLNFVSESLSKWFQQKLRINQNLINYSSVLSIIIISNNSSQT